MSAPSIARVNGPVVEVDGFDDVRMLELVAVGAGRLPGEVIALDGTRATVQVYEYTGGVRPGEPVTGTGAPLSAELGPGLLGGVFDGMLRRLDAAGDWIRTGARLPTLDPGRRWAFEPRALERAGAGSVLGVVHETPALEHRVLVPSGVSGDVEWMAPAGEYTVGEPVARVGGSAISLAHRWPVRQPRPVTARERLSAPLTTGQRALDLFFPVARGSTAAVPGGFGTGKTVLLQQIAKWCDARGHRLRRVRRARQRDGGRAARAAGARGSAHRAAADGAHRADREHVEHARARAGGKHPHGRHGRRVLP